MRQVLVRNLRASVVTRLKLRARQHRRSLQEELREILEHAAKQNTAAARASVDQVRKMFAGRTFRDSSELIQRDRAR